MTDQELIRMAQELSQEIEENAPEDDPRRTKNCLSWNQVQEIGRATAERGETPPILLEKWTHIANCPWCSKAVTGMEAELQRARTEETGVYDSTDPRFRYRAARIAASEADNLPPVLEGMLEKASAWLRQNALPMEADTPVYFDAEGTLHIALHQPGLRGVAQVSLDINGTPVPIGAARAQNGSLRLERALPELNLRNVRLPAELLRVG